MRVGPDVAQRKLTVADDARQQARDDDTWQFHLRRGDYSQWFRERIKDPGLADEAAVIERDQSLSAAQSRAQIRKLVERTYTAPAGPVLPMPGTDAAPKHK